jgi:hypothetical protein
MKLAICFHGLTRTWPHVKVDFLRKIKGRTDIDIYIHTWDFNGDEENPQTITPDFFNDLNPKKIVIENIGEVLQELNVSEKYLHQVRKRFLVVDLVPLEEKYQHIMLMRFDTIWNYIPDVIPDGVIYDNHTFPGGSIPGDWGFIGNSGDIRKMVDIFLDAYPQQLIGYCPHYILEQSIRKHNLQIVPMMCVIIFRYRNTKNLLYDGQINIDRHGKIV